MKLAAYSTTESCFRKSGRGLPHSKNFGPSQTLQIAERFGARQSSAAFIHSHARSERAFTMVEIALCLAVIGFALVAIIGVLPLGMQVQRDNRQETIVNRDGAYFIEAIRQGKPIEDLSIFVDSISLYSNTQPGTVFYDTKSDVPATNGYRVLGLLSNPTSSKNEAIVRSMSGAVQELGTNSSGPGSEVDFRYKVITQIRPFTNSTLGIWPAANNLALLQSNLVHEIRVTMRYPLLPNNQVGNGKKVFRALVSGDLRQEPDPFDALWFFHPERFTP